MQDGDFSLVMICMQLLEEFAFTSCNVHNYIKKFLDIFYKLQDIVWKLFIGNDEISWINCREILNNI